MTEAVKNDERLYPKGIYEVPGVEPVPVVLKEYGQQVAQRIQDIAQTTGGIPPIIAPLNGSVMPLYSVCREWQESGGCVQDLTHQIHLVSTRKIGDVAECLRLTNGDPGAFAFIVEDIIDDGGTGEIIEQTFSETTFELYAPLSKVGKLDGAQARLHRTKVSTTRTVQDLWIIGGGGLDGGSDKFNGSHPYQNVELAVAARLMDRYVYHNTEEPLPSYGQQLKTFMDAKIPDIELTSTLHTWMLRAEWAKMSGKFSVLHDLALLFPYVLESAVKS